MDSSTVATCPFAFAPTYPSSKRKSDLRSSFLIECNVVESFNILHSFFDDVEVYMNCHKFDNQREGLSVVKAGLLVKSLCFQSSLVFVGAAIWVFLESKDSFASYCLSMGLKRN